MWWRSSALIAALFAGLAALALAGCGFQPLYGGTTAGGAKLAEVMAARDQRPLLLIDLAVPRDIHPACREVAAVSLYDMDDLQSLVERNVSGREAEARRAEVILRAERAQFDRWLSAQDVTSTVAALRTRADEVVE